MTTRIDLLRHGEPIGGRRFRGITDDPLSESGWQQMREAVRMIDDWQVIVSSPLRRCIDFGCEVAEQTSLPVETEAGFAEMLFGEWEGLTPAQVEQSDAHALARFYHDPIRFPPPGGEPMQQFSQRVSQAWQTLLQQHAGKQVLLITHGGVIRMILQHILQSPLHNLFRIEVGFASMTRIVVDDDGEQYWPRIQQHGAVKNA